MSSMSKDEALARAKEIAARLSGESTTTTNTEAVVSTESASSSSITSKRKRWGVAPDVLTGVAGAASDVSKRWKAEDTTASAAALTTSTASTENLATKRVWIQTNDKRPPSHYVSFLVDKLAPIIQELEPGHAEKKSLQIELKGRGSTGKPPLPGMPEQPLHVLITGPKSVIEEAETRVEVLLAQAEEAPVQSLPESPENEDKTDNNLALTTLGARGSSSSGTYRPASVAQLIGQANLPPDDSAHSGDWMDEDVQVPNGVVGFIIGRGGENITSMQARTGCKVQIQKEHELQPGQTQRTITLSATNRAALDECREIIMNMVREKAASLGSSSGGGQSKDERLMQEAMAMGHKIVKLPVPDADVGLVIGKMGATIRSIQDQSGANIQVPPAADAAVGDGPLMRTIHITHPTEEGANYAKQLIQGVLQSKPSYATGRQQVTIQVPIPDKDVGLCIGRQGCVIREMQNRTSTRIQIPSHPVPGEMHRIASVSGSKEGVEQVQQMIQSIIAAQSSAPVMTGSSFVNGYGQQQQGYGQQDSQQQYSAEWAAYHAAQAAAQQQQQQQQQQYSTTSAYQAPVTGTAQPQTAAASAPAAAATNSTAGQPAADAYYEQFFRYAYYYGEEAARAYYGAWAPPVGTPNPYGVNPAGIQPAPAPSPTAAPAPTAPAAAVAPSAEARETGRRKVSNLPAWMTQQQG